MFPVSESIPNLINGISQQPYAVRIAGQGEQQENADSSPQDGLGIRRPTELIGLPWTTSANAHAAEVVRLAAGLVVAVVVHRDSGEIRVWRLPQTDDPLQTVSSETITVDDAEATAYLLLGGNAARDLRFHPIGDVIQIYNRNPIATPQMLPGETPELSNTALVEVIQGNYATDYQIVLDGYSVSFTTSEDDPETIKLSYIVRELVNALNVTLPLSNYGVTYRDGDPAFAITRFDGTAMSITVTDSGIGSAIRVAYQKVLRFADLPPVAPPGLVIQIRGDIATDEDDYWVEMVPSGTDPEPIGPGTWEETTGPGILTEIDPETMPVELYYDRDTDGFRLRLGVWTPRQVGDDRSNPIPSFVSAPGVTGFPINSMFMWKNRNHILARNAVCGSRTDDFGNYFRGSALAVLDDDPIDIKAITSESPTLYGSKTFGREAIITSDVQQLALRGLDLYTPASAVIDHETSFVADTLINPEVADRYLYFPFLSGSYSGMIEYFVGTDEDLKDGNVITQHVPRYVKGRVWGITSSTVDNLMAVRVAGPDNLFSNDDSVDVGEAHRLYVYKWIWNGNEKIQSSWSRWTFGEEPGRDGVTILGARFFGSFLYLIIHRNNVGVFVERMSMDRGRVDPEGTYLTRLDMRMDLETLNVTRNYSVTDDATTFTFPFVVEPLGLQFATRTTTDEVAAGVMPEKVDEDGFTVSVRGDWTGDIDLWAGIPIVQEYVLSRFFATEPSHTGGLRARIGGRLQVHDMQVEYSGAAYFKVKVEIDYSDPVIYEFTSKVVDTNSTTDAVELVSGSFEVPINAMNSEVRITLINDSIFPAYFTSIHWNGDYTP